MRYNILFAFHVKQLIIYPGGINSSGRRNEAQTISEIGKENRKEKKKRKAGSQ